MESTNRRNNKKKERTKERKCLKALLQCKPNYVEWNFQFYPIASLYENFSQALG